MGRRKSSEAGVIVVVVLVVGLIGAVGQFAVEHLIPILVIAGVGGAIWVAFKLASKGAAGAEAPGTQNNEVWTPIDSDVRGPRGRPRSSIRGQAAHALWCADGDEFWVAAGANGSVGARALGDLLYVGRGLRAVSQEATEPALIDPALSVTSGIRDCVVRRLSYWSSYTEATADARAAYLYWLQTGRREPGADIGYVFLYLYGLERRALYDARTSSSAASEIPLIAREVERLLGIYGSQRSFCRYASAFLDFLTVAALPARSYLNAPVERGADITLSHRLALAQCAADGVPLPANWAQFWVTHDRSVSLGTVPRRCPEEFRKMFEMTYRGKHGDGMLLPKNRTILRLEYRPASASLLEWRDGLSVEPGLPDVSVLSSPVRKLAEVAELACEKLARYSRIVGKDSKAAGSFEALVELPVALWPDEYRKQLEAVRDVVGRAGRPAAVPFDKFMSWMPAFAELTRTKVRALYVALSGVGLGMEPDVRFGGAVPGVDSRVVLFADDPGTAAEQGSPKYMAASLTLHLAAAVATADGEVAEAERTLLMKQMEEWLSLTESERRRLHAHLRLLLLEPPKLTGLKKRIESLDPPSRDAVADFLTLVAQADDRVTPDEIRQLQKIFRLLGLDPEGVFSRVHAAATEPVSMPEIGAVERRPGFSIPRPPPVESGPRAKPKAEGGLKLDAAKISMLQKDSERVAAILASVFDTPAAELDSTQTSVNEGSVRPLGEKLDAGGDAGDSSDSSAAGLLGLDAIHSALLETLLSRTQWSRAELEELADDRQLMLDGALESLSDACFEKLDVPLFEGSDPLELNPDAVRGILGVEHQES